MNDNFESLFSKLLLNIDELFEIAKKMFNNENEDYKGIEKKIQQLDNFCRRIILKNTYPNSTIRWAFHNEIVHAQRQLYHMLCYLEKKDIKIDKIHFYLLEECKKTYDLLKLAYIKKEIKPLENIHTSNKDLMNKIDNKLLNELKDPIIIHYLLSIFRGFYLSSSSLMGYLLNDSKF